MELEVWHVIVLAVIQGVAEFLPVSSSGHVVIFADWLGGGSESLDVSDLNIVLHVGTLLSIMVFYWHRVLRLLGRDRRMIGLLFVGTIPAVLVGLPVKLLASKLVLENSLLAGVMLLVTGALLVWISRHPAGTGEASQLTLGQAWWIGASQACAILPGLSRSGATISAGIWFGLNTKAAATFSFLLAIPIIAAGGGLELVKIVLEHGTDQQTSLGLLLVGLLVAFVVGLASLYVLLTILERGRLAQFAYWCIPMGMLAISWNLWQLANRA